MSKTEKPIVFISPVNNPILYEIGFWWHLIVWLPIFAFPFIFPLWVNALLVCVYRLCLMFFDGCVFSRIQEKLGILPPGLDYYQALAIRVFKYEKFDNYKGYVVTELTEVYFLTASVVMFLAGH